MMAVAQTLISYLIFIFTASIIPDGSVAYVDYIENGKIIETVLVEAKENVFVISQTGQEQLNQKLGSVEKLKSSENEYVWKDNINTSNLVNITDSIKFTGPEKSTVMIGTQKYRFQKAEGAFYLFGENGSQFVIRIK